MRYAELTPRTLAECWRRGMPAIVPIGALEWHGEHLPLGTDGLIVEYFAGLLFGVQLPVLYVPITTLPHKDSLDVPTEAAIAVWESTVDGLVRSGARSIVLLTGHYAQGHVIELYRLANRAMRRHVGVRVFAGSPLEPLADDSLLDHAGRWEAAQMLVCDPDLVRPCEDFEAVLGEDPNRATEVDGDQIFKRALDAWTSWLSSATPESLIAHHESREQAYSSYVERFYRESWEQAICDWWSARRAT